LRLVVFFREDGFLRAEAFLRAVVFFPLDVLLELFELDPLDLDDELLPPDDFGFDRRDDLFPLPTLDSGTDAPTDPLNDWICRFDASKTTAPAPPTALDRRYATVPPAANFARDLALPTREATSRKTPSTRFCPALFGVTASFNNLARLVGISHAFAPPSARLIISLRLLVTNTWGPLFLASHDGHLAYE
jgi:hypothetical protein